MAIGRAIVRKPEVFLFDEPLSNLDAALRVRMRYEFARLHDELETTMVYVTHDQVEAMTLADRIVVLSSGRIEQVGSPLELYENPENLFVAGFIGSPRMNFMPAQVAAVAPGLLTVKLVGGELVRCAVEPGEMRQGQSVTLGVRPEHFAHEGCDNTLQTTVMFVESLGSSTHAYFAMAGVEDAMACELPAHRRLRSGDLITLSVPPTRCYVFDESGRALRRLNPGFLQ